MRAQREAALRYRPRSMALRPGLPPQARRILELARSDRRAAGQALDTLPVPERVALVCETPVAHRAELLDLLADPGSVVRALPEAELCFTVKAVGLADAGWILEHARGEQIQACLDLDAWRDFAPEPAALDAWFEALAAASDRCVALAAKALDPELVVLWLRARADVVQNSGEPDWEPPTGAVTLDGQFYLTPRRTDDDLGTVMRLLRLLFERDYWFYFRMLQGVAWELPAELEEHALRWRAGRLQDLGFPAWEEAMRIYGFLRPEDRAKLPADERALPPGEWPLPVWLPRLPEGPALFRAAAALDPALRRAFFYAFVALANQVAVAERLPLGAPESLPEAIDKAAELAGRGLEFVSRENGLTPEEVLRRVPLGRLFRVGVSLDREGRAA